MNQPAFSLVESKTLVFRPLSATATEQAFARKSRPIEIYVNTVREFEGEIAYALPLNGSTQRQLKVNMNRAAKKLGLKLQWSNVPADAVELIVRLRDME